MPTLIAWQVDQSAAVCSLVTRGFCCLFACTQDVAAQGSLLLAELPQFRHPVHRSSEWHRRSFLCCGAPIYMLIFSHRFSRTFSLAPSSRRSTVSGRVRSSSGPTSPSPFRESNSLLFFQIKEMFHFSCKFELAVKYYWIL